MPEISRIAADLKLVDYDRYFTALLAPEPARAKLICLYAFNAELAKLPLSVSEPAIGFIRLAWWREILDEIKAGRTRNHPLVEAMRTQDLPLDAFAELIDGYEADIENPKPENLKELEARIRATTGKLHEIALVILGAEDENAEKLATGVSLAALYRLVRTTGKDVLPDDVSIDSVKQMALAELAETRMLPNAKPLFIMGELAKYHLRNPHAYRGIGYYWAALRRVFF